MGRRILLWGIALAGGLAVLEIGLRYGVGLGDPPLVSLNEQTEYELVPSRAYVRFGNAVEINAAGMRGPDIPLDKAPSERRVLLIGDSVIYGNHFLDQSEVIGARLHVRLADMPALAGCTPLVMAAAVSSWGPVNQARFLEKSGVLHADQGLILVSSHDLFDTPHYGSVIPYRTQTPFGALDEVRLLVLDRFAQRTPSTLSFEERRDASLAALDQIADQFAAADVPLLMVYHPTISERAAGAHDARGVFNQWADARGVEWVDLGDTPMSQELYRDDIHPNAQGAETIAAVFADVLRQRLVDC